MSKQILSLFSTQNIRVATALTTLVFKFESDSAPVTRVVRNSGEESTVFWFHSAHPETGESADEVSRRMTSEAEAFAEANPEHPVAYMHAYAANYRELLRVVKNTPRQVVIERNGKILSISENATEEDRKRFAKFL
jgi:hypothetical protein